MSHGLIAPHGGELVQLLAGAERAAALREASRDWPSWDLAERQLCDLELLLNGGFSPLRGFLARNDYESVCSRMRLADGTVWPIPVTLDLPESLAKSLGPGAALALRDPEGVMLAALHIEEVWKPDREAEARAVYGTTSREHPGVAHLLERTHPWYAGGRVQGVQPPAHHDFRALRLAPAELRAEFARMGWRKVVAFQTRNPMHRAHQELTFRAAREVEANLLIHPVVGMTKPGDVDHYTRVRAYQAILPRYPQHTAKLALLPLAMRLAGPREAVWHAVIRKNHGCTHLIVGRDHAGPGSDSKGKPFYGPYDAQEMLREHEKELGVTMVPFRMMVYVEDRDAYVPEDEVRSPEEGPDRCRIESRPEEGEQDTRHDGDLADPEDEHPAGEPPLAARGVLSDLADLLAELFTDLADLPAQFLPDVADLLGEPALELLLEQRKPLVEGDDELAPGHSHPLVQEVHERLRAIGTELLPEDLGTTMMDSGFPPGMLFQARALRKGSCTLCNGGHRLVNAGPCFKLTVSTPTGSAAPDASKACPRCPSES